MGRLIDMKKTFLIVFLFFSLPIVVFGSAALVGEECLIQSTACSGSCALYEQQTTGGGNASVGYSNSTDWGGQIYLAPTNDCICQLSFTLISYGEPGTEGYSYKVEIYTMNGTSLDELQATSSTVAGSDDWSSTVVNFEFPTPFQMTASTNYGFAIRKVGGGYDTTNYIRFNLETSNNLVFTDASEYACNWAYDYSIQNTKNPYDARLNVYTNQ